MRCEILMRSSDLSIFRYFFPSFYCHLFVGKTHTFTVIISIPLDAIPAHACIFCCVVFFYFSSSLYTFWLLTHEISWDEAQRHEKRERRKKKKKKKTILNTEKIKFETTIDAWWKSWTGSYKNIIFYCWYVSLDSSWHF